MTKFFLFVLLITSSCLAELNPCEQSVELLKEKIRYCESIDKASTEEYSQCARAVLSLRSSSQTNCSNYEMSLIQLKAKEAERQSDSCEVFKKHLEATISRCKSIKKQMIHGNYNQCAKEFKKEKDEYTSKCSINNTYNGIISCGPSFNTVLKDCEKVGYIGSRCAVTLRNLGTLNYKLEAQERIWCEDKIETNRKKFVQDYLPKESNTWNNCEWEIAETLQKRRSELLIDKPDSVLGSEEAFKLMVDLAYVYFALENYELSEILLLNSIDLFPFSDHHKKAYKILADLYQKTDNAEKHLVAFSKSIE